MKGQRKSFKYNLDKLIKNAKIKGNKGGGIANENMSLPEITIIRNNKEVSLDEIMARLPFESDESYEKIGAKFLSDNLKIDGSPKKIKKLKQDGGTHNDEDNKESASWWKSFMSNEANRKIEKLLLVISTLLTVATIYYIYLGSTRGFDYYISTNYPSLQGCLKDQTAGKLLVNSLFKRLTMSSRQETCMMVINKYSQDLERIDSTLFGSLVASHLRGLWKALSTKDTSSAVASIALGPINISFDVFIGIRNIWIKALITLYENTKQLGTMPKIEELQKESKGRSQIMPIHKEASREEEED